MGLLLKYKDKNWRLTSNLYKIKKASIFRAYNGRGDTISSKKASFLCSYSDIYAQRSKVIVEDFVFIITELDKLHITIPHLW